MKAKFIRFNNASKLKGGKPLDEKDWPESWKKIYFKGYPRFEKIILSRESWSKPIISLKEAILKRKSNRNYELQIKIISKDIVSSLMLFAGITRIEGDLEHFSHRAYPSAGARFPNEVYLIIRQSNDLKLGLYHFNVRANALEYLWNVEDNQIKSAFRGQDFVINSSMIVIITSVVLRGYVKYADRAYRFALIEAGHMMQNLLLLSEELGLNACPVGGFHDDNLIKILDLDPEAEIPLYTAVIY